MDMQTYLIDDMRRFVSFVNWHLTLLLEHSEQLEVSVASHWKSRISVRQYDQDWSNAP